MKKVSLIGTVRYLGFILIVIQGILITLFTVFMLNRTYQNQWNNYLQSSSSTNIYLKDISESYANNIRNYLHNQSAEKNLFIARKDLNSSNDGSFSGYTFGIYGNIENNNTSFEFLGRNIIKKDMLNKLLSSKANESTLGIDNGSVYSVGEIPSFRFGEKTVFKKLDYLINESGTINGDYIILGLKDNDKNSFIQGLSSECNVSADSLLKKTSGSINDDGLAKTILLVFIFAQIALNIVYFIIITIKNMSTSGKLALLGWSKRSYFIETLGVFFSYAIINIPIQIIVGILVSGWNEITTLFISHFALYALINVILVTLEISVSAIIQISISPLNAIKGRIPKNILYVLGIFAYIVVSVGIVFCGTYVDAPMKKVADNVLISQMWTSVSKYEMLKNVSIGNDESSITNNSKNLDQSFYDWYKDISDEDGVYLIKTKYYDNVILEKWKNNNVYKNIPSKPFWYFLYSPNYIESLDLNVDSNTLNEAKSGTKVYLIPKSYSEDEKNRLKSWLTESSTKGIKEGDISTVFNKEKNIKFAEYNPSSNMFTWNIKSNYENTCDNPIIYICTPENMTYFQSESLRAVGFDGYIKFINKTVAEKYLNKDMLKKYKLDDNNLEFTDVKNYIDGLQKDLLTTITWFGLVFLILMFILLGILIALATVYRIANQEKINVKKFLGYGFINLYHIPIIMLISVIFIELTTMVIIGSQFGFLLMLILAIIQILIFSRYMTKCEIQNIRMAFKGE